MIEAVRHSGYALPWSVSYNGLEIPFAYPPLGFYLAAALADLADSSAIQVLRFLPLALNLLAVLAFWSLGTLVLRSAVASVAALWAFVLMPGSYLWLIMGGGLTRSLGFLFALLALRQAYLYFTTRSRASLVGLALCCGLTLLSHPAMTTFLVFSMPLLFLAFGRSRATLAGAAITAAVAALIAAPWWLILLTRYGFAPVAAAAQTGSLLSYSITGVTGPAELVVLLVAFGACVAVFYLMGRTGDRRFVVLGWLGLIFFLDFRESLWLFTVPVALVAGEAVESIASLLRGWVTAYARSLPLLPRRIRPADLLANALVLLVVGFIGVRVSRGFAVWQSAMLLPLSSEERAAMRWISAETRPSDTFLVVSGDIWAADRSSEWFPVFTQRVSVATPQGREWIPGSGFVERVDQHARLQACGGRDGDCLEQWQNATQTAFSHVYVARRSGLICCEPLRASLRADARYTQVFDGPGASIFARVAAVAEQRP